MVPALDVTTRTRLSKPREAYLKTRAAHREAPYEALLAAGRERWAPGERVRYYRAKGGTYVLLPDEDDDDGSPAEEARRDYDVEHYLRVLVGTYASRLRKAFAPEDFERIFRLDTQVGFFDRPVSEIEPRWIRCPEGDGGLARSESHDAGERHRGVEPDHGRRLADRGARK